MQMYDLPDARGHFGPYGGVFVAETLTAALEELRVAYERARGDAAFQAEFRYELKHYVGRPSPIYFAKRLTEKCAAAGIYIKREDLNHTGAHKINNTIGQALLARSMKKPRVIAETGAGMHGVASATVAARYGMECVVYMGSEDVKRQSANVARMKMLGAKVVPVESGSKTLKDALNEAMRDWVTNVDSTFYTAGSICRSTWTRCALPRRCSSASMTSRRSARPSARRNPRCEPFTNSRWKHSRTASISWCARTRFCITWCATLSAPWSTLARASTRRSG